MLSDAFKHSNFRSGPKRSPAVITCISFSHSYSVVSLCLITRERKEAGRAWRWRSLAGLSVLFIPWCVWCFQAHWHSWPQPMFRWRTLAADTLYSHPLFMAPLWPGVSIFFSPASIQPATNFCVDTPTLGICPVGGKRSLAFLSSLSFFSFSTWFFSLLFLLPFFQHGTVSCNSPMALYLAHTLWLFFQCRLFHCICIRGVVAYRAMEERASVAYVTCQIQGYAGVAIWIALHQWNSRLDALISS